MSQTGLQNLTHRFPAVEQFYHLLGDIRTSLMVSRPDGQPGEMAPPRVGWFDWLNSPAIHAVAKLGTGFLVAFIYAGPWWDYAKARRKWHERFNGLNQGNTIGMENMRETGAAGCLDACPSLWVVVGHDRWSVQAALDEFHPQGDSGIAGYSISDGWLSEIPELLPSQDFIQDMRGHLRVGNPDNFGSWVDSQLRLLARGGPLTNRVFSAVEAWHGAIVSQVAIHARESRSSVRKILRQLVAAGLVVGLDRQYYLTKLGLLLAARRDRISPLHAYARLGWLVDDDQSERLRVLKHDKGVNLLAARLAEAGVPVIPGWRAIREIALDPEVAAELNLRETIKIAPDLMAYLGDGPFGARWYALEYERSAGTLKAVAEKLFPYAALARVGKPVPLLVVTERVRAAVIFQAASAQLPLLTTTLSDAKQGALVGAESVWLHHGAPTFLHPPRKPGA